MTLLRPLAGGRWARTDSTPVLYTCLERDGALAEISFHLTQLDPLPSKPVMLHRIRASAGSVLRLLRADLLTLGVQLGKYATLGYERTQEIGSAVAFLECNGLLAPSARWSCENLMLFTNNHASGEQLALDGSEQVDWISWAREHMGSP